MCKGVKTIYSTINNKVNNYNILRLKFSSFVYIKIIIWKKIHFIPESSKNVVIECSKHIK
jgi:hypothetical protein